MLPCKRLGGSQPSVLLTAHVQAWTTVATVGVSWEAGKLHLVQSSRACGDCKQLFGQRVGRCGILLRQDVATHVRLSGLKSNCQRSAEQVSQIYYRAKVCASAPSSALTTWPPWSNANVLIDLSPQLLESSSIALAMNAVPLSTKFHQGPTIDTSSEGYTQIYGHQLGLMRTLAGLSSNTATLVTKKRIRCVRTLYQVRGEHTEVRSRSCTCIAWMSTLFTHRAVVFPCG